MLRTSKREILSSDKAKSAEIMVIYSEHFSTLSGGKRSIFEAVVSLFCPPLWRFFSSLVKVCINGSKSDSLFIKYAVLKKKPFYDTLKIS